MRGEQAGYASVDQERPPYVWAALTALVVLAIYLATLAPTTAFWDTSEYIAAAKVLGTISYSIYLTHCIALFVTVHAVDRLAPMQTLDGGAYWLLAALAAAGCVLLSAFTFARHQPFLGEHVGADHIA